MFSDQNFVCISNTCPAHLILLIWMKLERIHG
jgi:hypothetical protein